MLRKVYKMKLCANIILQNVAHTAIKAVIGAQRGKSWRFANHSEAIIGMQSNHWTRYAGVSRPLNIKECAVVRPDQVQWATVLYHQRTGTKAIITAPGSTIQKHVHRGHV